MKHMDLFTLKMKSEFGGSLLKGRRKAARPLGIKKSNHLVLKAKNPWLLLKNKQRVGDIINKYALRFGIQILAFAVHSDHIHICFRTQNREAYRKWIRAATSVLVQRLKGLKFALRPWTRIVEWGKAFKGVLAYMHHNITEASLMETALRTTEMFKEKLLSRLGCDPYLIVD